MVFTTAVVEMVRDYNAYDAAQLCRIRRSKFFLRVRDNHEKSSESKFAGLWIFQLFIMGHSYQDLYTKVRKRNVVSEMAEGIRDGNYGA